MDGVVTRVDTDVTDPMFEVAFYEVKDVTGRRSTPLTSAVNMVSCHGDSRRATEEEFETVDDSGRRATRERPYFDWGYVCPTNEAYRTELLELIDACVAIAPDVRLDDVGFARAEYCRCARCETLVAESSATDRWDWRETVVTDFLEEATDRIDGRSYLTVYPDPYPNHLSRRSGINLEAAAELVDEIVVPLYDLAYETTYWIEAIASAFADRVTDASLGIELYGIDIDLENLVNATEVADAYASSVYIAYDADTARAVAKRRDTV